MSEPFLAQIAIFGFNFPPRGWATCDGQILPINQNQSLYSLLGTTYGGDGRTTFALPELRGRVPIHKGSSNSTDHTLGSKAGDETITLTIPQIPNHTHDLKGTNNAASSTDASNNVLAKGGGNFYANFGTPAAMGAASVSTVGGQAHDNMQPYLVLNFCIAVQGLFPSRN